MLHLDPDKLKTLLGRSLSYQGVPCQVIEILGEESPDLVLRDLRDHQVIQPNQYGDAGGWTPQMFTIRVLNVHGDRFNPDVPELAALDLLA
ncbi:conserved hypothetical protein [Candidatus Contendobacter odensis Run_B_J11]|uniref:Uncharacterized protein n=2 Tax=Candidatus Contendibacter odensensis TaxID=1400860 RepID=A0A7U7GG69_9GAMM|nr:hypothetical protein [Candidatus Competibacteraceae bacterium]CDH47705.1 conserved hypothetical protein [Candidatus Contendobacter odensis Run_B_J11]